jgi:pumilio family protein 6
MKTLVEALVVPYPSSNASNPHPVDLSWTSRMYKTLLQGGHFNRKTQAVDTSEHWDASQFASTFMDTASRDVVIAMCTEGERNGTFLLVTLCESLLKQGDEKTVERQKLRGYFGEKELKMVQTGVGKGKDLLLEKLALM